MATKGWTTWTEEDARAELALWKKSGKLTRLAFDNARLTADNARLLRKALGKTSEKVSTKQLDMLIKLVLDPQEQLAAPGDTAAAGEAPAGRSGKKKPKKRDKHGRGVLPAHLPREERVVPVEGDARRCPICGEERACIGHAVSESLEYSPASLIAN